MLDIDDIKQELWVWFITHTNKLNEWETNHSEKDYEMLHKSIAQKKKPK
jgi:hypothetical protein